MPGIEFHAEDVSGRIRTYRPQRFTFGYVPFQMSRHGVRQHNDYTCSVACLLTVRRILKMSEMAYHDLEHELGCHPVEGVHEDDLIKVSRQMFKGMTVGEKTYQGGLAIACLMEDLDEQEGPEGHYVIFLGVQGHQLHYYCPHEHRVQIRQLSEINWRSEFSGHHFWSMNIPLMK